LAYFSVDWWVYTEHNGERVINSDAQKKLIDVAIDIPELSIDERHRIAQELWDKEKGQAAAVIIIGWLLKVNSLPCQVC
jgi:inositol phosphorylceramide synthase regulatory subunit